MLLLPGREPAGNVGMLLGFHSSGFLWALWFLMYYLLYLLHYIK